jgi:hypothetical protein
MLSPSLILGGMDDGEVEGDREVVSPVLELFEQVWTMTR